MNSSCTIRIRGFASSSIANPILFPAAMWKRSSLLIWRGAKMTTEAKVGIFVAAGIVAVSYGIYFVRTTQTVRGKVPYVTYVRYAGGVAPGSDVLFGGIKVGQVAAV